jgi:hypothetical protein
MPKINFTLTSRYDSPSFEQAALLSKLNINIKFDFKTCSLEVEWPDDQNFQKEIKLNNNSLNNNSLTFIKYKGHYAAFPASQKYVAK